MSNVMLCDVAGCDEPAERVIYNIARVCLGHEKDHKYGDTLTLKRQAEALGDELLEAHFQSAMDGPASSRGQALGRIVNHIEALKRELAELRLLRPHVRHQLVCHHIPMPPSSGPFVLHMASTPSDLLKAPNCSCGLAEALKEIEKLRGG